MCRSSVSTGRAAAPKRPATALVLTAALLAACGQKGPLTLPPPVSAASAAAPGR